MCWVCAIRSQEPQSRAEGLQGPAGILGAKILLSAAQESQVLPCSGIQLRAEPCQDLAS